MSIKAQVPEIQKQLGSSIGDNDPQTSLEQ